MKAIEFPEVNVRIAENQPEYETLPVYVDTEDPSTPTTMCIQLDPEEIKQVTETGRIWMQVLTFRQPFHPIRMSFLKPEGFTEPETGRKANTQVPGVFGSRIKIDWYAHLQAWKGYAKEFGAGQSAEKIHERGGFGEEELNEYFPDWRKYIVR